MGRNILVTGGAGYIGSHVCKTLSEQGYIPVTYDNLFSGHKWAVNWGPMEFGDILDKSRLSEVMGDYQPLAVIHMAGRIEVGESVREPGTFWEANVTGTINVLDAMVVNSVPNIVFSSTCAIFRQSDTLLTEEEPLAPISPYAKTKAVVEMILNDYHQAKGIRSVALRFFNAAGADPSGEIGEAHDPETHLIPLACEVALGKRKKLNIFGSDYSTPDGTCVRDYVHVSDLAQAHLKSLEYMKREDGAFAFNLGNGNGYSVLDVIKSVGEASGKKVSTEMMERRSGDSAALVGSNIKAREVLGWAPEYPELKSIVETAWNWHQARNND